MIDLALAAAALVALVVVLVVDRKLRSRPYEVWRVDRETRLDLHAAPLWKRMSQLTRNAIVRHVWLALEAIAGCAVVDVDSPRQRWDREIEARLGGGRSTLPAGLVAAATAPQYYKS